MQPILSFIEGFILYIFICLTNRSTQFAVGQVERRFEEHPLLDDKAHYFKHCSMDRPNKNVNVQFEGRKCSHFKQRATTLVSKDSMQSLPWLFQFSVSNMWC